MLFNFFADSAARRRSSTSAARRSTRSRRPAIEGLEDRKLLTGFILQNCFTTPEGTGANHEASFTVSLASPSTTPVSVQYKTVDYTAVAGSDYVATSGTVTFAPGETSKQVPVTIIGDSQLEQNESFLLNLSSPTNGIVLVANGVCTIMDDDAAVPPSVSINDTAQYRGFDGTQLMAFNVTLNAPATSNVSVTATTANLSAIAGVDYLATTKVLNFAPGQSTQQFFVPLIGTSKPTGDKVFTVTLSNTNATLNRAIGAGIIKYGDGVATAPPTTVTPAADLKLSINDISVTRGFSGTKSAAFTVSLNGISDAPVTVTVTTSNLSAIAGDSYQATSQVLTFAPGQTTQQFVVPVYGTTVSSGSKIFLATLSKSNVGLNRTIGAAILNYGA
jgi:hypothetical protein